MLDSDFLIFLTLNARHFSVILCVGRIQNVVIHKRILLVRIVNSLAPFIVQVLGRESPFFLLCKTAISSQSVTGLVSDV